MKSVCGATAELAVLEQGRLNSPAAARSMCRVPGSRSSPACPSVRRGVRVAARPGVDSSREIEISGVPGSARGYAGACSKASRGRLAPRQVRWLRQRPGLAGPAVESSPPCPTSSRQRAVRGSSRNRLDWVRRVRSPSCRRGCREHANAVRRPAAQAAGEHRAHPRQAVPCGGYGGRYV